MAKPGPDLFSDLFEEDKRQEALKELPADPTWCQHAREWWKATVTVWPGETCERFTWTCSLCGYVRGRCP